MKTNEQNTEQVILEAAEAEFLEKGYDGAKMLSIARRAGVAHSMLHYSVSSGHVAEDARDCALVPRNFRARLIIRGDFKPPP